MAKTKTTTKKTAARKPAATKSKAATTKKTAARKPAATKSKAATTKKTATRKPAATKSKAATTKKTAARKPAATKSKAATTKKTATRKPAATKSKAATTKKTAAKKPAATKSKAASRKKPTAAKKPATRQAKPEAIGMSLHIGVNKVSTRHYGGWDGELRAPESDAKAMEKLAKSMGFKTTRLLTTRAKRDAVLDKMLAAAKALNAGDIFFLSYSGHGGQARDMNRDEKDRKDETWCCYDGQLLDDEIYWALTKFKKGVRIVSMVDCCHSGTALKDIQDKKKKDRYPKRKKKVVPMDALLKTLSKNREFYKKIGKSAKLKNMPKTIDATVIQVSACQDDEVAYDGSKYSLFTEYLLKVWNNGKFTGGHKALHREINELIPLGSPNYFSFGTSNASFTRSKPFKI